MVRLARDFYARETLRVARDLLGQRLVRHVRGQVLAARIVEVEAYVGHDDQACHASRGRTARNAVMFGPPGYAYVYFVYGMHHCVNAVTEPEGSAAAVLIRAVEPLQGLDVMRQNRKGRRGVDLTNGPAKLCYALEIERVLNGADLVSGQALWIERDRAVPDTDVASGPRIGVRGDERALTVPWRLWVRDHPYVSRARSTGRNK
jgi:DNA-3-methyladenine glycosylase